MSTTLAQRFVANVNGKPAPISSETEANDPDTIYSGGLEHIASFDGVAAVEMNVPSNLECFDNSDPDYDDEIPLSLQDGAGYYFFKDGSEAGVRYDIAGTWDAWVLK